MGIAGAMGAAAAVGAAGQQHMPRGSYLRKPVFSAAQLVKEAESDPIVMRRYSVLFKVKPPMVGAALRQLHVARLEQPTVAQVFYVHHKQNEEVLGYKVRRIGKGTEVFELPNGTPALIRVCGNPVRSASDHAPPGFAVAAELQRSGKQRSPSASDRVKDFDPEEPVVVQENTRPKPIGTVTPLTEIVNVTRPQSLMGDASPMDFVPVAHIVYNPTPMDGSPMDASVSEPPPSNAFAGEIPATLPDQFQPSAAAVPPAAVETAGLFGWLNSMQGLVDGDDKPPKPKGGGGPIVLTPEPRSTTLLLCGIVPVASCLRRRKLPPDH